MKKVFSIFGTVLLFGVVSMFCSCGSDELSEPDVPVQETSGWHSAKVKFNIVCEGFDQKEGSTRAAGDQWQDGDVVYILLTDKDGNKVQAYVKYDGSKQEWGDVIYDGYKSYLTCSSERVAEAYYIEGMSTLGSSTLSFSNNKAVYACTDGSYVYPADGDMTLSVVLKPLTGRIRFEGKDNSTASISGIKTYTAFSVSTGKFTESTAAVNTKVAADGSTPYIYCVFANTSELSLTVTTDKTYKTVFDASSTILKPGKSGFMSLPTADDHRGWRTIVPVTSITLTPTTLMLEKGKSSTLTAKVLPEDATDKTLTWTSSNTAVATVDNTGKVTAVADGTATITVTSASDGSKKATCSLEVTNDKLFTVSGVTFRMNLVEAGSFSMGTSANGSNVTPVHNVTLTKDYYMGETEVTQALWKAVTGYSPTSDGSSWTSSYGIGDEYPAYYISYEDVRSFLTKLNSLTGQNFRMPTEAEWEFAAKGGTKSKGYTYSGSNTIGDVAWYTDNSSETHPVKTKVANELGLYDMSGNVWEWCSDWYGSYSSSAQTDPTGATSGNSRVRRGGSWIGDATSCRCVYRNSAPPSSRYSSVGFRLALPAK